MADGCGQGMGRREFLAGALGGAAGLAVCPGLVGAAGTGLGEASGARPVGKGAGRRNVLLICVDDLRVQLGCYGHAETLSPNIDRLAAGGTVFERAYCQSPVCGPSRVAVLTGRRTRSSQWRTDQLEGPFVSLGRHLRESGYYAISNGKVFHHMNDRAEDWSEPPWRSEAIYHGEGDWAGYNRYNQWQNPESAEHVSEEGRGPYCEAAEVVDEAYQDGRVAARTIADLKRCREMDKPFFIAAGFWRPHLPLNAPRKYWDMYDRAKIEMAKNRYRPEGLPEQCTNSTEIYRYGRVAGRTSDKDFHREARHGYYACVSYVDAQVGKVLDALEELGLAESTAVVLWGDHGWHLGEHDFWGKHNVLHNAVRAPLIVRAPGVKGGQRSEALVEFVDIYPTLCDLAGVERPGHLAGRSLAGLLEAPGGRGKEAAYTTYSGARGVVTGRYLYAHWQRDGQVGERMLFDHKVDPEENVNVAERAAYAEVVERLGRLAGQDEYYGY